jgi:rsbT co-antagonist protein RsbR
MDANASLTTDDVLNRLADILLVLAGVGSGDYEARLTKDLHDEHPFMRLYDGVNQMISSLAAEQARNASYQQDLEEKLATIEQQREAIRELSTPIIEVWDDVLCLPIVGVMDSVRSAEMTEALLGAIVEKRAGCAIIDITGIQVMDTATADHFLRMARSVRLLGSECVITGINPAIALTMQTMGVGLSDIVTLRSLRDALQRYVDRDREFGARRRRSKRIGGSKWSER